MHLNQKIERGKLRWNCTESGCFNQLRRPKIEQFADCFPGRIALGDVDGICQIGECFFLLEWKTQGRNILTGQRILYERLSAKGFWVLIVNGNAETMEVQAYCEFWNGKQLQWRAANFNDVHSRIKKWADWAEGLKKSSKAFAGRKTC